jgi:hypothetical protein
MTGTITLDLIQENLREWITTGGMTGVTAESMAVDMATDMIVAMETAEVMAVATVGDMVDIYMGTVPDTGEAMGMAEEAMEEAMQEIIEDIMAGDTDTEGALEWAEVTGAPITGDHVINATATGIENI